MKDNHIGMHPLLHRYKPPNDLDEPLPSPTRPLSINEADKAKTTLASLPPEVHLLITPYLSYPDALSLKHASRYFYDLVYTGVNLKIEWLIERRRLHLDCPVDIGRGCELGSDVRFCRGSVALLMKRRREHGECDTRPGGRGCLVFGTGVCTYRKIEKRKWVLLLQWVGKFMRENGLLAWAIVALLGAVLACGWLSLHDSQAQASELEL